MCRILYLQGLGFYTFLGLAVHKDSEGNWKRKLQLKTPRGQKNLRGHPAQPQLTTHSAYENFLYSISDKLSSSC